MTTRQPGGGHEPAGQSLRHELEVALAARRELSPDMDDALIRSFLDRVDLEIDRRIQAGIAARDRALTRRERSIWSYIVFAIVVMSSTGAAAIASLAAAQYGPLGLAIVWLVTLIVNVLAYVRR